MQMTVHTKFGVQNWAYVLWKAVCKQMKPILVGVVKNLYEYV